MGKGHWQGRAHRVLHSRPREGCRRPRGRPGRPGDRGLSEGSSQPAGEQSSRQPASRPPRTNITSTPKEPRPGYTAVGRVLRPHALRGELRVTAFSPSARNLQRGRPVRLAGVRRVVLRARQDRDAWILKLEGLEDRSEIEALRGELLETPDREVIRDDDDSFFVHELIGLRVVTSDGRDLGTIADVLQSGAADVYVVRGPGGEVLIPATGEVVQSISLAEGRAVITPLPGMLDESK
ncbi:MAG: 16S rRNA processing protein RimM [Anaerolinea sp.]|nr:16S rRNA processing protein RimM [Anaerolinea sp.]